MQWVLQDNLINPETRDQVVRLLAERGVPCTRVKLIPIFNQLDGHPPTLSGPVFVYGSTSLGNVAKAQRWSPGYFDENLDYELMLAKYGDLALNAGAACSTLSEVTRRNDRFFLRPTLDAKSFAGTVMTWDELESFRRGVASIADVPDATLRLTDRVVVAPLMEIAAEYRFFVIARCVVTGSRYKLGNQVRSVPEVPGEVATFAQACVDVWSPNDAFAIDVAVTGDGLKVIEVNSANSAGFYACDVGKLIDAVNERLS